MTESGTSAAVEVSGKKPRRTQAERRGESTDRMLDAAVSLLAERRSLAFSLAEVAERAGYSRGQPTHIFGSRDEMIRQVVPHLHVKSDALFGDPANRGEGVEAILKSASLLLDERPGQADITIAVHVFLSEATSEEAPFREQVRRLNSRATTYIAKHLRIAVERGEIRPGFNVEARSSIIMAMIRGALLLWLADPTTSLPELKAELLAMLEASLGCVA